MTRGWAVFLNKPCTTRSAEWIGHCQISWLNSCSHAPSPPENSRVLLRPWPLGSGVVTGGTPRRRIIEMVFPQVTSAPDQYEFTGHQASDHHPVRHIGYVGVETGLARRPIRLFAPDHT